MKKRNLWIYIFGITIIIIGLIKLDTLISMVSILWNACSLSVWSYDGICDQLSYGQN